MIPSLEPRLREVGRIRIGATEGEKRRPVKLETFRLTSPNLASIERAASIWGGEPEVWADAPGEGEQWQVTTGTSVLPVIVPPQDVAGGQYYELYSGGGCQRRCDGRIELLTGGPCICDAEGAGDDRPCQVTTHLLVILAMLPDVGVWRITTHGYNAAVEIPATVDLLATVSGGRAPKALLGIEVRTSKAAGQTRHFAVPVLRSEHALTDVANHAGLPGAGPTTAAPELESSPAQSESPATATTTAASTARSERAPVAGGSSAPQQGHGGTERAAGGSEAAGEDASGPSAPSCIHPEANRHKTANGKVRCGVCAEIVEAA